METDPSGIMDEFTRWHFENWLWQHVWDGERLAVRDAILKLIEDDPDLLRDHSWPELREMADVEHVEKLNTGTANY